MLRPGPATCLALALAACQGGAPSVASAARPDEPVGPVQAAATGETARVDAVHRAGQTFVTFSERAAAPEVRYRVYRTPRAPSPADLTAGARLATLGAGSGLAVTDRYVGRDGRWQKRYLDRWVVDPRAGELPPETGLYVLTLHPDDLGGAPEAQSYYTVTAAAPGEAERVLATSGAVTERVAAPQAVRARTSGDGRGHVYVQYMDLRRWNPTFHAPRRENGYLGYEATAPVSRDALAYAYTYLVSEPEPKNCGGAVPARLPVFFTLHGWGGGAYRDEPGATQYFCALQIAPTDFGETWWFGFARDQDYRAGPPKAGDAIVDFTEQRLLRMLDDLTRDAALGPTVDPDRVYVWGHSMGGSGALALATRYPEIFAAAYASQPMTDHARDPQWLKDVTPKWGTPESALPVELRASPRLARYSGTPVFDWQHHPAQIRARLADEMAPFGVSHGRSDAVLAWPVQGRPAYADFDAGRRAWAGAITDADHTWAAFAGLPPALEGDRSLAPFQGFRVRRGETVPGLSGNSGNGPLPPPDAPAPAPRYNAQVRWASSWDPWAPPPEDTADRWCMSLKTTDGSTVSVEVTPRRTQRFKPAPGSRWQAVVSPPVAGAAPAPPLIASPEGLVASPLQVTPGGVRLCLTRG